MNKQENKSNNRDVKPKTLENKETQKKTLVINNASGKIINLDKLKEDNRRKIVLLNPELTYKDRYRNVEKKTTDENNSSKKKPDTVTKGMAGDMIKKIALEKARDIIIKNKALESRKRGIKLIEDPNEKTKLEILSEKKRKRNELEENKQRYFLMIYELLKWKYYDLESIIKYREALKKEVPIRFKTGEEYYNFFKPLVMEECRVSIAQQLFGFIRKYVIKIIATEIKNDWITWKFCTCEENKRKFEDMKAMDLVVLFPFDDNKNSVINNNTDNIKYEDLKRILELKEHVVGLIDISLFKKEVIYEVKFVNEDFFCDIEVGFPKTMYLNKTKCDKYYIFNLCNVITSLREFESVYMTKRSSIFEYILNPVDYNYPAEYRKTLIDSNTCFNANINEKFELHKKKLLTENNNDIGVYNSNVDNNSSNVGNVAFASKQNVCEIRKNLSPKEKIILRVIKEHGILNESQLEALNFILSNKNKISLIQGPPGTGKTKTIIGIISALHALINEDSFYDSNNEKSDEFKINYYYNDVNTYGTKKILVCSPSNSAIDEIAIRIVKNGLYNFKNIKYKKKINDNDSLGKNMHIDLNTDEFLKNTSNELVGTQEQHIYKLLNDYFDMYDKTYNSGHCVGSNFNDPLYINPKCIRLGQSNRTHDDLKHISLDFLFNSKNSNKQGVYISHFNNKVALLGNAISATLYTYLEIRKLKYGPKLDSVSEKISIAKDKAFMMDINYFNNEEDFNKMGLNYFFPIDTNASSSSIVKQGNTTMLGTYKKVDNIKNFFTEKYIKAVDNKYLEKLLSYYNKSYSDYDWSKFELFLEIKRILQEIYKLKTLFNEVGSFYCNNNNREQLIAGSDIIFSTLSSSASQAIEKMEFEYLIIDEACQCVELSCLIPFRLRVKNIIMVGDLKQLPSTIMSDDCRSYGYDRSLFERLILCNVPSVMLNIQYRMRPEISHFPNNFFYDGLIMNAKSVMKAPLYTCAFLKKKFGTYKFIDIAGIESLTYNKSYVNYVEAYFIFKLVTSIQQILIHKKDSKLTAANLLHNIFNSISLKNIGIICPYQSQVHLIRKMFDSHFTNYDRPEVSTVDSFQGREKNIIIFSCVRSKLQSSTVFGKIDDVVINLNNDSYSYVPHKKKGCSKNKNMNARYSDDDKLHVIKWLNKKNGNSGSTSSSSSYSSDSDSSNVSNMYVGNNNTRGHYNTSVNTNCALHVKNLLNVNEDNNNNSKGSSKTTSISGGDKKNNSNNHFETVQKQGYNIGFLKDERRLNVALTRAKDFLWIVGNKENLERDDTWNALLEDAISRKCYNCLKLDFTKCTNTNSINKKIDNFFLRSKTFGEEKWQ
uniref:DNA2/NAM7 helicase n=1 Tax=Piliocolobus tephrosceles TaxID=591936 RepID=A0A8C9GT03_9PRIM